MRGHCLLRGALLPCALLTSCSLFAGDPVAPPPAQSWGTFHALSDSETPTDFVASGSQVWVGTSRGLLRYDAGAEEPGRLRTTDGLPADEILALGANAREIWAATPAGLVMLRGGEVVPHISDYPFVGRIRSLAVEQDGRLWVGGSAGVARFSGTEWTKWTDRYDVTQIVPTDDDGTWIATQGNGIARLKDNILYEHGVSGGLPAAFIRNVVPRPRGEAVVLAQGSDGTSVGYWHGGRWYTYTLKGDEKLVALLEVDGQPTLLTPSRMLTLVFDGSVADDAMHLAPTSVGPDAEPRQFRVSPAQPSGEPGPMPEANRFPAPMRPIPQAAEAPSGAPEIGFTAKPLAVGAPVVAARGAGEGILLGTVGLGVIRLESDQQTNYRTRDLVLVDRAFTVATDAQGFSYVLTRDGRAAQFDGERLAIVDVTDDPTMKVVAFATGGHGPQMNAFALAHAPGTTWWRIFRREGDHWTLHVDRELQSADGVEDVTFFGIDPEGDFWLGLKVKLANRILERGVAVMSPNRPEVVYHHSTATAEVDGTGAKKIPDTLSSVAFEPEGGVWFASLDGAVRVSAEEVVVYGEERGLQGGVVGAVDILPGGIPIVATHGGVGRFADGRWQFERDRRVVDLHPICLAIDGNARVWIGSNHGVLVGDEGNWSGVRQADGLLSEEVTAIKVDGANRIWFVTSEGISLLTQ